MKNVSFWLVLAAVASLLPLLYLAYVWPQLPALVPIHFALDGRADGMGDRSVGWVLAALPLLLLALLLVLPRIDPKKQLDATNPNYQKLMLTLIVSLSAFSCLSTRAGLVGQLPAHSVLLVLCGTLVLLGNYLTSVPPNYFAGIRTPWTLDNPVVWQRTHRVGGWALVVAGLLGLLLGWLLPASWADVTVMTVLLLAVLGSVAYSYLVWRQLNAETARQG